MDLNRNLMQKQQFIIINEEDLNKLTISPISPIRTKKIKKIYQINKVKNFEMLNISFVKY